MRNYYIWLAALSSWVQENRLNVVFLGYSKIITNDFNECQMQSCEGDFNVGSYWNISDYSKNICPVSNIPN